MPSTGRDPYLRAWVKVLTYTLDQPAYKRLSFDEFGVFMKALLYSTAKSQDIGYFCDKVTGRPWTLDEIGRAIRPDDGDTAAWVKRVETAFGALMAGPEPLVLHDPEDGYYFAPEVFEQFLHENNREAKRKADATRQARRRARQAGASPNGHKPRRPRASIPASPPPRTPPPLLRDVTSQRHSRSRDVTRGHA